jgi:hypothetical protein
MDLGEFGVNGETESGHDQVRLGKVGECLLSAFGRSRAWCRQAWSGNKLAGEGQAKNRSYVASGLLWIGGNSLVGLWRLLMVESMVSVSAKVTEMVVLGCGQRIERLA